jgi:hypothetical protein
MPRSSQGLRLAGIALLVGLLPAHAAQAADEVATESGKLQGIANSDYTVRIFKGIPLPLHRREICAGKLGNPRPNGRASGWPKNSVVMRLPDKDIHATSDALGARYEFLDEQTVKPKPPTPYTKDKNHVS